VSRGISPFQSARRANSLRRPSIAADIVPVRSASSHGGLTSVRPVQHVLIFVVAAAFLFLGLQTSVRVAGLIAVASLLLGLRRRSMIRISAWHLPVQLIVTGAMVWLLAYLLTRAGVVDLHRLGLTTISWTVRGVWLGLLAAIMFGYLVFVAVRWFQGGRAIPVLPPGLTPVAVHPALFRIAFFRAGRGPGRWLATELQALGYALLLGLFRQASEEVDAELDDVDIDHWLSWQNVVTSAVKDIKGAVADAGEDVITEAMYAQACRDHITDERKRHKRRRSDLIALVIGIALIVTAIAPWMIGKLVLQPHFRWACLCWW